LKQVVLPAPLGPSQRMDGVALDLQVDVGDGNEALEFLGQVFCLDDVIVSHACLPVSARLVPDRGCGREAGFQMGYAVYADHPSTFVDIKATVWGACQMRL